MDNLPPAAGRLALPVLAMALLLSPAPGRGQGWHGDGRLQGVVEDVQGEPLQGATVSLRLEASPQLGPPSVRTDRKGRWVIGGVAPGRYRLVIEAEGFITSNGWATVPAAGVAEPVEAQLLPLAWSPPAASEGNWATVLQWIEKGNSLLQQGQPVAARAEYEKALPLLPADERPEVLQAIARAQFLQGDAEAAATTLERALRLSPRDERLRQIYTVLRTDQGRGDEAARFLAEVEHLPPPEEEEQDAPSFQLPPEVAALLAAPPDPPLPHRVGSYKTSFSERSPLSSLAEYAARMTVSDRDLKAVDPAAAAYDLRSETFQVVVPEGYEPATPYGLLVWISPTPFGGFRQPQNLELMAQHRLIWVGANQAGNRRMLWDRVGLALDAVHNLRQLYTLDVRRIYVGGYSGGGRTASRMAVLYPDVFRGGWSLYGCDYFRDIPIPERPGTHWPARYPRPPKDELDSIRRDSRFVLMTGTRDFNFTQTRAIYRRMLEDGFQHVTYLEVPDADHYTLPAAEWFARVLEGLDGRAAGPATGG